MWAVLCQVLLAATACGLVATRTLSDWDAAGYVLPVYFLIQLLANVRSRQSKKATQQDALPLHDNQCFYCCVPSKGKVAFTRLEWLLVLQSLTVNAWVWMFFQSNRHEAFFVVILLNVIGLLSYYHMMIVEQRLCIHVLYLIILGIHITWGVVNNKSI